MTFVDPTSLDLPSTSSTAATGYDSDAGPSRKRPRSELSSEERKEARAHRNRIAAQNSRDKRKAQFSYLERRVAELEEENKRLRAGVHPSPAQSLRDDSPRDKENEELRERIKTLEKGWDAVLKALAVQGVPLQLPTVAAQPAPQPQLPVQQLAAPSPAPSHSSLDSDMSTTLPLFSSTSTPSSSELQDEAVTTQDDSTRHLARVATIPGVNSSAGGFASLFSFDSSSPYPPTNLINQLTQSSNQEGAHVLTEQAMESLFHEILVEQPEAQVAEVNVDQLGPEGTNNPINFSIKAETKASSLGFEEMTFEAFGIESPGSSNASLFGDPDPVLDISLNLDFDNEEMKKLLEEYCSIPPVAVPAPSPLPGLSESVSVF